MLCPNCKTELIEVNGRYICSDCGKEVPENEVMTSDWSNSTPVAAGIYDAAGAASTTEEGSMPVATFETLSEESEKATEPQVQSVEEVLQDQNDEAEATAPVVEKTPEALASESVESVLQDQADAAAAERPVEAPPINLDIPPVDIEPASETVTPVDNGFYVAPETPVPTPEISTEPVVDGPIPDVPVTPITSATVSAPPTVIPTEVEESRSLDVARDDNVIAAGPALAPVTTIPEVQNIPVSVPVSEPVPMAPAPEAQEIPVNVSVPEIPVPVAPVPEQPISQQEVVKDMFEDVPSAPINDPGLYASNLDDSAGNSQPTQSATPTVPLSMEKRTNILILAIGSALALCLIGGGTWAYIALNQKAAPVVSPVIDTQATNWQELQVVDAGFKISFPGQPDKTEGTQTIGGLDTPVITESYTSDDSVYTAAYATVNASADKLPTFVDDLAKSQSLDVVTTKVGKYFTADAVDFTFGRDSATYKGKIMLKGNTYILVMAGSSSGQSVDYDKFIKSFSFITANTGE